MKGLTHILGFALLAAGYAQAKAVFAHFMVSNAVNYTRDDWVSDVQLAKAVDITAFALNVAHDENWNNQVIYDLVFGVARDKGFKLFFSFDYAGSGPWTAADVTTLLNKYGGDSAHYRYNGQPFVSTFEGPKQAEDWIKIKADTGCFLVPDWSSEGAKAAMELAGGVADGLFSWAAWPWGNQNMDTYVDASYLNYLNGKPYMMPVSPWFYTNLPGYDKNWLWKGDHLWFDRWNEVMYIQPEWVEIISWNDYGESHYIGPIRQNALGALDTGKAPFNYVDNMPHDSWRTFLWFSIDMYLNNITFLTQEQIVYWYRPNPAAACGSGQTSGNTASQLQLEFQPASVMEDAVFYSALLTSDADVTVSIGGVAQAGKWLSKPDGGIGIYHGQVPFNGHTGSVSITLSRKGTTLATNTGRDITAACQGGLANWNAWVGEATSSQQTLQIPYLASDKVCVSGTGAYNFAGLCDFSCKYGYCPVGACLCTGIGTQKTKPNSTGVVGYPKAGLDASYSGLCSFNCDLGYCPPEACGTVSAPLTIPTVSDFLPPACTSGEGPGNWGGLCSYSCNFGFCPIGICTCTQKGTLVLPPPVLHDTKGFALNGVNDFGLCNFACPRGYCPPAACDQVANGGSGDPVYIDGGIWTNPTQIPGFGCAAPCVGVLPPYKLPGTTTLSCPPLTTTLTESWQLGSSHVTVSTISFKAITTTAIPVFNINITNGNVDKATYAVTPSIFCVQPITVGPPAGITTPALTYYITSTPPPGVIWPPLTSVKSSVSYTSTSPPFPTCTQAGGCGGHKCKSGCSGCGKDGCGCQGCCDGCGGRGGGGGGGGGKPPGGCVGAGCPPGTGPPGGGGGSGGGGGGGGDPNDPDDPECTSSTTVTDTTVLCTLSASPGSLTMDTTCTSTNYATSTGCELSATTTTSYHSVGCPTLPPYIPDRDDPNALLPAPGDSDWGGYLYATGTYTWAGDSPTTTTTKTTPVVSGPTAVPTGKARWDMYFWQHGSDPWTFSGYDNGMTLCLDKPAWTTPGGSRKVPDSLSGITVYGDSSCSFAKSSMTLTCSKWKAVTCKDVSQAGSGDAGTCATGADQYCPKVDVNIVKGGSIARLIAKIFV